MQSITTCFPRKAIIHVLDNSSNTLITSDYELDMNDDVHEYLKKHIMKTVQDDKTRVAHFNFPENNLVQTCCQAIFSDSAQFVTQTQHIATHLFNIMSANKAISSSDLLICLYEADEESYLAILKMDYTESYIHDFVAAPEEGKIKLTIKKGTTSLPHPNQRLQKAVFVSPYYPGAEFDFVVLDKQITSKESDDDIALFFLKLFLNGTLVSRNRDKTVEFVDLTRKWISECTEPNEANQMFSLLGNTLSEDEPIEAQQINEAMFSPGSPIYAKRTDYETYLDEKGFSDMNFSVEPEVAQKHLKRLRWVTEEGIEIIIKTPANADKVSISTDLAGNSSIIITGVKLVGQ